MAEKKFSFTDAALVSGPFSSATNDVSTSAAIPGAATINLDATTGNRVHVTGAGWTCTAVTLTRGPRTVIFDGIGTLAHHSTTNNLPGAANILTAPGDRAIYESDGTTVYCVSYTKASGESVASGGAGDHSLVLTSGNGHGSTNTMIRRLAVIQSSSGTDITYVDSATLGATITINETGFYAIYYLDRASTYMFIGVSVNSTQLTTQIGQIAVADRLLYNGAGTDPLVVSGTVFLTAGDVIRLHTNGAPSFTDVSNTFFRIRKVGT